MAMYCDDCGALVRVGRAASWRRSQPFCKACGCRRLVSKEDRKSDAPVAPVAPVKSFRVLITHWEAETYTERWCATLAEAQFVANRLKALGGDTSVQIDEMIDGKLVNRQIVK